MKIAIDGPAGAGKSTVAKAIAAKMHINYLDTGAMYRAAAYAMLEQGIEPADAARVVPALGTLDMTIEYNNQVQKVLVNGQDVTPYIRTSRISKGASDIAVIPVSYTHLDVYKRQDKDYVFDPELKDELVKSATRGFTTGFFFGNPGEAGQDTQRDIDLRRYTFTGKVLDLSLIHI